MCTVSFFKNEHQVILTSNRDESAQRPAALDPAEDTVNGVKLYFPRDPVGGGSWFAVNESGHAFVLLNGAETKHHHQPPYRMSRGAVLLQLASATNFELHWKEIDLTNIEPFTVIAHRKELLTQISWDGSVRKFHTLNDAEPRIWSSATLYHPEVIRQRAKWFQMWMEQTPEPDAEDLIQFHATTQTEDPENGLIINRSGVVMTKNITQVVLTRNAFKMLHLDLIRNTRSVITQQVI